MPELGWSFLVTALVSSCIGLISASFSGNSSSQLYSRLCFTATLACTVSSYVLLILLFLGDRFDVVAVYQYSERALSSLYKISASWSGMHGSLLFWTVNLLFFSALGLMRYESFNGYRIVFCSCTFLLGISAFLANPFKYVQTNGEIINDGLGLNPLLHNFYMLIHPVVIYAGLNSTIYIVLKHVGVGNAQTLDFVELFGWCLLTVGILLGGYWAYIELGWGGYWAWDPVENASFIPWLTYTAYLHLSKHKFGRSLALFTALLTHFFTVLGTFLTRSGIVLSVHTFSNSEVAWYLQWYVYVVLAITAISFVKLLPNLSPAQGLFNQIMTVKWLLFVFYALSILWGVLFAPFSETFLDQRILLGIPFYENISIPYLVLTLALMPLGLLCWTGNLEMKPVITISAVTLFLTFAITWKSGVYFSLTEIIFILLLALNFSLLFFAILRVRNASKLCGVCIHVFVALIGVGLLFSYGRKVERNLTLKKNEPAVVEGHTLVFTGIDVQRNHVFEQVTANILVDNELLRPASRYYYKKNQLTAEVDISKKITGDFYLALVEIDPNETWIAVKLYRNPWISLVWFGSVGLIVAALLRYLVFAKTKCFC
ncbi:MAG: cytochrome c biogenesis protein CcsA [Deltaproteobacteria bacterium]|nr:cytochrome c biogenesis protein CcsA [Deltaproteobacteria bacterium]